MARRYEDRPRKRKPGAGRPRKRARRSEGPVDAEIIGAAARLFARHGVASTTMADIADEVGLGVSSLYYYFRNKPAIVERIVDDVNQVPIRILNDARAAYDRPALQLYAFIRGDAEALCRFPFDINEIHRLAAEEPDTFARYWEDRQWLLREVASIIAAGSAVGDFLPVDADLTALTVLANDEAAQNWFRLPLGAGLAPPVIPSAAEVGSLLADLVIRGLLVEPHSLAQIRGQASGIASDGGDA